MSQKTYINRTIPQYMVKAFLDCSELLLSKLTLPWPVLGNELIEGFHSRKCCLSLSKIVTRQCHPTKPTNYLDIFNTVDLFDKVTPAACCQTKSIHMIVRWLIFDCIEREGIQHELPVKYTHITAKESCHG